MDIPELGRSSSLPVTYAGVLAGDVHAPSAPKQESQLRDLLNMSLDAGIKPISGFYLSEEIYGYNVLK